MNPLPALYVAALANLELLSVADQLEETRRRAQERAKLRGVCLVWRVYPRRLEAVEEVLPTGVVQPLLAGPVQVRT